LKNKWKTILTNTLKNTLGNTLKNIETYNENTLKNAFEKYIEQKYIEHTKKIH
jgi:ABC-type transporter MlaC component